VIMFGRKALSLLGSTHPLPSFAVATFAALFGVGVGLSADRVVLVGLAVLFQQFSVGLSNDWLDLNRDRSSGRIDKPAALGSVSGASVRNSSLIAGALALSISTLFGWETLVWMVLMLVVGWAYNVGLKFNGFSIAPYAVGFGILPIFVTLAMEQNVIPPFWVILVAALLGVSAHFANTLPDLLDDRATGVRALPHILGQKVSALIIAGTAVSASSIAVYGSVNLAPVIGLLGLLITILLAGLASLLALRPTPPRVIFPLLIMASFVNVVLLMLGVGSLVA